MKKVKLNAGETVMFSFEIIVSIEKDCVFDKSILKDLLKDCALNYICSIGKKEFQFDDGEDY